MFSEFYHPNQITSSRHRFHLLMQEAAKNCGDSCNQPQVSSVLLIALRISFQPFEVHQINCEKGI